MGPQLVSIGEAFDDLIFYDLPRLPRPGEELKTSRFARVPGGGVITTAITAARLGIRTRVISAVSDLAKSKLRSEHIALRDLRRPGEQPALSVALSTGRDRSFVTYNGVNDALETRLLDEVRGLAAAHVHCAFYPARCRRWTNAVRALRRRRRTVSWDFGWNPPLNRDGAFSSLLSELDIVFVNEAEARFYSRASSMPAVLAWWRTHARRTIVKRGRRGAVYLSTDAVIRMPGVAVTAVDTTGAGDAFNGGYLAAYLRGQDAGACLRAGNEAGARATTRAGGS